MGLETELGKLVEEQSAGPGIKCLLYKNANNPTVAVHGSILAGTSSEPSGKSGLAELTTRLLIRGTRKLGPGKIADQDRKSTRLNSSHRTISYAVFCLKKKKKKKQTKTHINIHKHT